MIFKIFLCVLGALFLSFVCLNLFYIFVVRYNDQEEFIKRGSRVKNLYDVVAFGSSYCRYAFNFDKTPKKGYNFGIVAQFLYYTNLMIRSFRGAYKDNAIVLIVLPDLVFAESGKGLYGSSRYVRFIDKALLKDEYSLKNKILFSYFPLFIPNLTYLKKCIKRIITYKNVDVYNSQRHNSLSISQNISTAEQRCKDWCKEFHLIDTKSSDIPLQLQAKFELSTTILSEIIEYCLEEHLRPVLVVTPVSDIMREQLSKQFLDKVLYSNIKKSNIRNIPFLDYLYDERFADIDLYANNADFLNARGRELFTDIVLKDIRRFYD